MRVAWHGLPHAETSSESCAKGGNSLPQLTVWKTPDCGECRTEQKCFSAETGGQKYRK
jgi:hypothetical protein